MRYIFDIDNLTDYSLIKDTFKSLLSRLNFTILSVMATAVPLILKYSN